MSIDIEEVKKHLVVILDTEDLNEHSEDTLNDCFIALEQQQAEIEKLKKESENRLHHVGYTNGWQLFYATENQGGEGSFYHNTDNDTVIPLYMLRTHYNRIETSSEMCVTIDDLQNNND